MSKEVIEKDPNLKANHDEKYKRPRMWRVLLHNDDFTTVPFVVEVLKAIFHKQEEEAYHVAMQVHNQGIGICGVYTHEIAETKCLQVINMAAAEEFPLQASMEPDA